MIFPEWKDNMSEILIFFFFSIIFWDVIRLSVLTEKQKLNEQMPFSSKMSLSLVSLWI